MKSRQLMAAYDVAMDATVMPELLLEHSLPQY